MKKHWKKVVIGLVLLLTFTNPSSKDFNDYLKGIGQKTDGYRSGYFLIFSTFNHTYIDRRGLGINNFEGEEVSINFTHQYTYIGIFKNFFVISQK